MIEQLHALADGNRVGILTWDRKQDRLGFQYDPVWMESSKSYPLSLSLAMSGGSYRHAVVEAFIVGLLPDNPLVLDEWAMRFKVSSKNPFRLLSHVGEDCAGAIQFVHPDRLDHYSATRKSGEVVWLREDQLAERIDLLMKNHGATRLGGTEGQFSLAGAQPKIALFWDDQKERWGVPSGTMPTTHILKPSGSDLKGHAENEYFCLRLADMLGFVAAKSQISQIGDRSVIVVERYDRIRSGGRVIRVHQEDMCQSLGIHPRLKYQREGGPSPGDILHHILANSSNPNIDCQRFVDALIFNYLIGGTDAHAKNYSFLIAASGQVRLAPLYDIASVFPYTHLYNPRKTRLAMKVGGRYKMAEIGKAAWGKAAHKWNMRESEMFQRIRELGGSLIDGLDSAVAETKGQGIDHPIIDLTADLIKKHAQKRLPGINSAFVIMETAPVTCPTCFEIFDVPLPGIDETPCELDYDCEICCRPLVIKCWYDDAFESVTAEAFGMEE